MCEVTWLLKRAGKQVLRDNFGWRTRITLYLRRIFCSSSYSYTRGFSYLGLVTFTLFDALLCANNDIHNASLPDCLLCHFQRIWKKRAGLKYRYVLRHQCAPSEPRFERWWTWWNGWKDCRSMGTTMKKLWMREKSLKFCRPIGEIRFQHLAHEAAVGWQEPDP